jgi:hypothetical protein
MKTTKIQKPAPILYVGIDIKLLLSDIVLHIEMDGLQFNIVLFRHFDNIRFFLGFVF